MANQSPTIENPPDPTFTVSLPRLMDEKCLANYTGKSVHTIRKDRLEGSGIPYVKFGRHVRYRACDVAEFLEKNLRHSTCEEA